jgi:radical SAM-linked protein
MGSRRSRKKLSVSLSTFVPKPHTPFQWVTQISLTETQDRLRKLRRELKPLGIQVKWQNPHLSLLEGAFSRGDRRLAAVLMRACELGCRFDGWSDQFRGDLWEQAFDDCGIALESYATRIWNPDAILPWRHIDTGVSRDFLLEEYRRAMTGQLTPDCREGDCQGCSLCDEGAVQPRLASTPAKRSPFPGMQAFQSIYHRSRGREARRKLRVRYSKTGSARFLSHLELNNVIVRALRRGQIPLQFSQGFHPMPRIDFGPALPVGVESQEEFFDMETFGHLRADEVLQILRDEFPGGMQAEDCHEIPGDAPSLFRAHTRTHYRIQIPGDVGPTGEALSRRIDHLSPTLSGDEGGDTKAKIEAIDIALPDTIQIRVISNPDRGVRLLELLGTILDLPEEEVRQLNILKTRVDFLRRSDEIAAEVRMGGRGEGDGECPPSL